MISTQAVARSRWAAFGAAIAVTLGTGGILTTSASIGSGERAVYAPITPCRLFDTRPAPDNVGTRTSPLAANDTFAVTVRGTNGNCTIPADAVGLVMNVAVISPTEDSFLTVFPSDSTRPLAASANWLAGDPPLSNAVTADISADGRVSFYNLKGTVHLAVDIVGFYVDHTHDDLYYTKSQIDSGYYTKAQIDGGYSNTAQADARYAPLRTTIAFDGIELKTSTPLGMINNCATVTAGVVTNQPLPLALPIGSRIAAVRISMYDGATAEPYEIRFTKHTTASFGNAITQLGPTMTGGASTTAAQVERELVLATPEPIVFGTTFYLRFALTAGTAAANAVCQVRVELIP